MTAGKPCTVTGAFGFTGRYIAERLLAAGTSVRTLTAHPDRASSLGKPIASAPLDFDKPDDLAKFLRGSDTLFNTYWVRFNHGRNTFDRAVRNTKTLFDAATRAGVGKIVHISISNPSLDSRLPYFRGKAELEDHLAGLGGRYAILRPTVVFGVGDILINNIAWLLRKFPFFVVPGSGEYRLQPVAVEDLADLAIRAGEAKESSIIDAVGPETYSFNELVLAIAHAVGARGRLVHAPPNVAWLAARFFGVFLRDIVLTRDEVAGLIANLLVSKAPPTGKRSFREFLSENAGVLGRDYASELARHYRRPAPSPLRKS